MATQIRPFTELLLKPIWLDDAKPAWLKPEFGLERDKDDLAAHVRAEVEKRFVELDRFFGLTSNSSNIWELRAKALVTRELGAQFDDKDWWMFLSWRLANQFVPGFTIKQIGQKRRGRPLSRSDEHFAQLFADVEYLRRNTGWTIGKIFKNLRSKSGYERRWGRYSSEKLRKDYQEAKKRRAEPKFEFLLCGMSALSPSDNDRISSAIENHALKSLDAKVRK
jgi:hypothetical protein